MKREEEKKTTKLSVRLTPQEKEKLRKYADERGKTISQVVLELLNQII